MSTNDANEQGNPLTISRPAEADIELTAYRELADTVSRELLLLQFGSGQTEGTEFVAFNDTDEKFDLSSVVLSLSRVKSDEQVTVRLVSGTGAIQKHIAASDLRCRDPKTGDLIPDSPFRNKGGGSTGTASDDAVTVTKVTARPKGKRSPSVIPRKVERKGRYGFAVQWDDGATIIYSLLCIARAAGAQLKS